VRENESVYIPQGEVHRLANPGKILLEMIEVQTGSYLGEGRHHPHRRRVWSRLRHWSDILEGLRICEQAEGLAEPPSRQP
jgi:hypothetical protein